MIANKFLKRHLASQAKYGAMVQTSNRGFAGGGPKKPAMSSNETDFDIVFIGKYRASQRLFV